MSDRQRKRLQVEQHNREYVMQQEYKLAREIMKAEGLKDREWESPVKRQRARSAVLSKLAVMAALSAIPYR